jgi:hypothetical protein
MTAARNQRVAAATQLARVERAHRVQMRDALLQVGRRLGWDEQIVTRICEAITGRPWQRSTSTDVIRVAKVLLEVAMALRCASAGDSVVHSDVVDWRACRSASAARTVGR